MKMNEEKKASIPLFQNDFITSTMFDGTRRKNKLLNIHSSPALSSIMHGNNHKKIEDDGNLSCKTKHIPASIFLGFMRFFSIFISRRLIMIYLKGFLPHIFI